MALVAFDLDNTLGYFYHIGIWADFFSVDTIENTFNRKINPGLRLSASLKTKLRRAEVLYIKKLLKSPKILKTTLRPNLGEFIKPLRETKGTVVIYSNTWNSFTPRIAKALIETIYKCPGLFDCLVDATHPIRREDWKEKTDGQPAKSFKTLKAIFTDLCGVKGHIEPSDILFVDDRYPRHKLYGEGVEYLKPTAFDPKLTSPERIEIFRLGLDVLQETGLMDDEEYLKSDVFFCKKYLTTDTTMRIKGIEDLFKIVGKKILLEGVDGVPFKNDTKEIRKCMREYLSGMP